MCVDLPLMLILSVVCQADDGTIVDLRTTDNDNINTGLLFSTPSQSQSSNTNIETRTTTTTTSNSFPKHNDDDNDNNNNNSFLPYCDLEHSGTSCFDRQDDSSREGFFECRDGSYVKHYENCKDAGDHTDEQLDDDNDNNNNDIERIGDDLKHVFDNDNNNNDNDNNNNNEDIEDIGDELGDIMK